MARATQLGLVRLLNERKSQCASNELVQLAYDGQDPRSAVPTTMEEWCDFLAGSATKVQEGKASR